MKKSLALPTFVILLSGVSAFAAPAQALVAAPLPATIGVAYVSLGFLQVFVVMFLFLFIPIAFFGMILRSLGFKKEGKGWRWNFGDAILLFLKYLLYHVVLLGLWFIALSWFTGTKYINHPGPDGYGYASEQGLLESFQLLIKGHALTFALYIVAWAIVGPYLAYLWHRMRGKPTFRPSIGLHARLAVWNLLVFCGAALFVHIVLS